MSTDPQLSQAALRAAHDALAMRGPGIDGGPFYMRTAQPSDYMTAARKELAEAALAELSKGGLMDAASLAARVRGRIAAILAGRPSQS